MTFSKANVPEADKQSIKRYSRHNFDPFFYLTTSQKSLSITRSLSPTLSNSLALFLSHSASLFVLPCIILCFLPPISPIIKGLHCDPLGVSSLCPCPTTYHSSSCSLPCPSWCPLSGSNVTSRTISSTTNTSTFKIQVISFHPVI